MLQLPHCPAPVFRMPLDVGLPRWFECLKLKDITASTVGFCEPGCPATEFKSPLSPTAAGSLLATSGLICVCNSMYTIAPPCPFTRKRMVLLKVSIIHLNSPSEPNVSLHLGLQSFP